MSLEKSWLIRTKNHHLLGPVSKKKVQELISNNSIKSEDELCDGNGYWFFVREQNLVAKYVFGDETQGFNPVQESEPVLTAENASEPVSASSAEEENLLPSEQDLDYPEVDDITTVGMNLNQVMADEANIPDIPVKKKPVPKKKAKLAPEPKKAEPVKKRAPKPVAKKKKTPAPIKAIEEEMIIDEPVGAKAFSGKTLIIVTFILVLAGLLLLYFRGSVVKKLIELTHHVGISEVYAQSIDLSKKKTGLI